MTAQIKVKVQRKAIVKLKVLPRIPASLVAGDGIEIDKAGSTYTVSLDPALTSIIEGTRSFGSYALAQVAEVGADTSVIVLDNYYSTLVGGYGVWNKLASAPGVAKKYHLQTADGHWFIYAPTGDIELKAIGAKGDLSQDDGPYIEAALEFAAGRPVHGDISRFRFDNPIVYDGLWHLIGDGDGSAVLDVTGDIAPVLSDDNCTQFVRNFEDGPSFSNTSYFPVILRSFQLNTAEGITPASDGVGIFLSGPAEGPPLYPDLPIAFQRGSLIDGVAIANHYDLIDLLRPYRPTITRCFGTSWQNVAVLYRTTTGTEGNGGVMFGCQWWGNPGSTTQLACVHAQVGYLEVSNCLLLGASIGVFGNPKNGSAGALWVRHNWIENQGWYGVLAQSADGSPAAMWDFSENNFSNVEHTTNWVASIGVEDYSSGTDWITNLRISRNVHRHVIGSGQRFIWVQTGQQVFIQGEQLEVIGAGTGTIGIDVSANATAALKAPVSILDCQFMGTIATHYAGNATAHIRDTIAGVPFASLPTCANASEFWVTDGTAGSNPLATSGSGCRAVRIGAAWISVPEITSRNTWTERQIINRNATALTAFAGNSPLHMAGADSTSPYALFDTFAGAATILARRANGTNASKTTLVNGNAIAALGGGGWDGSVYSDFQSGFGAFAAGTWSVSSHPAYMDLYSTDTGSTTVTSRGRVEIDGGLTWPSSVTGGSKGAGTINVSGNYYIAGTLLKNATETLTNKTIDGTANTISNVRGATIASFSANKAGTSQTGVADATFSKVTFTTEAFDVGGYYDSTNSKWTPPAGKVLLTAACQLQGTLAAGAFHAVAIYKNGSRIDTALFPPTGATDCFPSVTTIDAANGTDYYEVYCYIDTSAGTGTVVGDITETRFRGSLL